MASLDEIERALRAADAAGNVDDARALSQAYTQMKGAAQPQQPPQAKPNRLMDAVFGNPGQRFAGTPGTPFWDSNVPLGERIGNAVSGTAQQAGRDVVSAGQGVIGAIPGIPGDIEALGRALPNIAGATMGNPWPSGRQIMPTSTEVTNMMFGPPADEEQAASRALGGLAAVRQGGRGAATISRMVAPNRGIPPEAVGTNYVTNTMNKAGRTIADLQASDKPITSAEALGAQGQTNLMALARRPGATADDLQAAMTTRSAERGGRIQDDLASAAGVHPAAAKGDIETLVDMGRGAAAPLFKEALGSQAPVWNQELARLAQRPAVRKAIGLAVEDLKNADINPQSMGLELDPMMGATGAKQLQPTAEAWDRVRKALGRTIERDPFGKPVPDSISAGNHNITAATRDLTGALKSAIPGYGDALDVSGEYLRSKSAFERGQSMILDNKVTEGQFAQTVSKLAPSELEAFKGGIANKIFDLSQGGKLRPAQILTPRVKAKMAAALGPAKAAQFIGDLEKESAMRAFEMRAGPAAGSQTQPLAQAMKEQDTFGQTPASELIGSMAQHGVRGAATRLGASTLQKIGARLKTTGLSEEARNEAGRLLLLPPDELASLLRSAAAKNGGKN